MPLWFSLPAALREEQLASLPRISKQWRHLEKLARQAEAAASAAASTPSPAPAQPAAKRKRTKSSKSSAAADGNSAAAAAAAAALSNDLKRQLLYPRDFLPRLITDFFEVLASIDCTSDSHATDADNRAKIHYCERFLEFVTELLSQLPTRRFLRIVIDALHFYVKCKNSALFGSPAGAYVVFIHAHTLTSPCPYSLGHYLDNVVIYCHAAVAQVVSIVVGHTAILPRIRDQRLYRRALERERHECLALRPHPAHPACGVSALYADTALVCVGQRRQCRESAYAQAVPPGAG